MVTSFYKDAKEGKEFTGWSLDKLKNEHQFDFEKTILATSVCSDEVIRSATNFRDSMSMKNPFQLGGLAGFPFTGITGFKAFASHVPDDGFAIFLYGPHIGISESGNLGSVLRVGQHDESTCCGALKGAVTNLSVSKQAEFDKELDYQQWKITDQLAQFQEEINSDDNPLMKATEKMFDCIDKRIKQLLVQTASHFEGNKIALVGGIIINTDVGKPDWFDLREFSVQSF